MKNNTDPFSQETSRLQQQIELVSLAINFFKKNYVFMLTSMLIGLGLAITFASLGKVKYLTVSRVELAKTPSIEFGYDPSALPLQSPMHLILLIRNFGADDLPSNSQCKEWVENGNVAFNASQEVGSLGNTQINIAVSSVTEDEGLACSRAIFDFIKSQQFKIIEPFLIESKRRIKDNNEEINKILIFLSKEGSISNNKSSESASLYYQIIKDLKNNNNSLLNYESNASAYLPQLIWVSTPQKFVNNSRIFIYSFIGLLLGFMMGLFITLLIKFLKKLRELN